jgi:hypothetical protein
MPTHDLKDLAALVRAGTPLILIETPEEPRVVELFRRLIGELFRPLYRWTITTGLTRLDLDLEDPERGGSDASSALRSIAGHTQRGLYLLLDFHPYLGYASHQRQLRELMQGENGVQHTIVMVGGRIELPPELESRAVRFSLRLPDEKALRKLVRDELIAYQREHGGRRVVVDPQVEIALVRNLKGLSLPDAQRIARQLIFDDGVLDASDLPRLGKLKFELLNKGGVLQYEPDTTKFGDVAGLRKLKRWVEQRGAGLRGEPLPPGLDAPRGILLLGVQGCGKSLAAKAVAGGFGVPLLRLDFGALYDKFHGETERKLRESLAAAEQLAPCVVWMDEVEKGLAGSSGDDGLSKRVLGTFLTWMAEHKSGVFLVATANAIDELPPELLRKGRFDEIFFVDLPKPDVREAVLGLHLKRRKVDVEGWAFAPLVAASEGFSGAEIEQAVVSALYAAHGADELIEPKHVLHEMQNTRPLSVLMAERVNALREWASTRTVAAD